MNDYKAYDTLGAVSKLHKHIVNVLYPKYIKIKGNSDAVYQSFMYGNEPKDVKNIERYFIPIYQVQHSSVMPNEFVLVKSLSQIDNGSVLQNGYAEVCLYAKNVQLKSNSTLPNLTFLQTFTEMVYSKLDNTIFDNFSITNIRSTIVNDADNGYHYNSLLLNLINVKTKK